MKRSSKKIPSTNASDNVITRDTIIHDVMRLGPAKVKPVFDRHRLYCASCLAGSTEPLRYVAQNYGIDLEKFIAEIEKALAD